MAPKFDPIILEILWRRIISIVDEADASVARTAFSSIIRDAHDYTCMFADRRGREIAQGTFCTPGQAGAMALGIKKWIDLLPEASYKPGDVFITNDPWLLAGHLNDVCVMSPIFYKDELSAFTACVFHHGDIGGKVSMDCSDIFEEGLFIPPLKLYDGGVLNEAVMNLIRRNVRTPEEVTGDIRSQIAANNVCSQKIVEMMAEASLDNLDDLAHEIIVRTEKSMRDAIEEVPDGIYTSEGMIEQIGNRGDIKIKVAVEVKGSDIIIDLEGSSAEVDWGGNVVYNYTFAYVFMAIKSMFDPETPNNEGSTIPIILKIPEGCVLNCKPPAAVLARSQVGPFMTELIYRALAPSMREMVLADSGGNPNAVSRFRGKRHNGTPWHCSIMRMGGMGASYSHDGHYCALFPANAMNTPCEIFESDTPLVIEKKELLCDSGGPGRMRGGLGQQLVFKVPDDEFAPNSPTALLTHGGRFRHPPEGLFGGKPGCKAQFLINGVPQDLGKSLFLKPGDVLTYVNPGGGGYGDPLERDPEMVEADVINGYVSIEKARKDYGVVINPKTMKLLEATQELRILLNTKHNHEKSK